MSAGAAVGLRHPGKEAGKCRGPQDFVLHPRGRVCSVPATGPGAELRAGLTRQVWPDLSPGLPGWEGPRVSPPFWVHS